METRIFFYIPFKVRFSETDMNGHLNNTVPFVYFETARIEYLHHLGFNEKRKNIIVVADQQCDYLAQVYFNEKIKVFTKINTIGNSSVDLHYLGEKADGSICFTGRSTIVNFNQATGKAERWTEEERKRFEAAQIIQ